MKLLEQEEVGTVCKFILRIDDVGRLPTDGNPELGTDSDLSYFAQWRRETGIVDVLAVLGIVPTWLDEEGLKWVRVCLPGKHVAVHGWDHKRTTKMDRSLLTLAAFQFGLGVPNYIAPFNLYSIQEIIDWGHAGGSYFFGGFPIEHHQFGELPLQIGRVIHYSAVRELYGTADQILSNLPKYLEDESDQVEVHVITLHVPWEKNPKSVMKLVDTVSNHLILPELSHGCTRRLSCVDPVGKV